MGKLNYDYIFFDLDGTLSDSAPGIVNSVVYALTEMGTEITDRQQLKKFVGPPLPESFSQYFGYTPEQITQAVTHFRAYFQERGILENTMYTGADLMLQALSDAGKILIVATSKPEPFARVILNRYGIDRYFRYIAGCRIDETRTGKDEVIAYALNECGISDPSRVVMVGDRSHDVIGARKNGIDCIGVLFGYGDRQELESAGALGTVESFDELLALLI